MLPQDLRRDVDQMNVRLHRENKATLNGQQTLRLWYDSLEGVSHEKDMYFLEKFFHLIMKDNDLRGYNRELDACHDELEDTNLKILIENEAILCARYLKQVRYHPWMKEHMAHWTRMPQKEQTYAWLRQTVQRVLDERQVIENTKCWSDKAKALSMHGAHINVESKEKKKSAQGICNQWKNNGRCTRDSCPYVHDGRAASTPRSRSKGSGKGGKDRSASRRGRSDSRGKGRGKTKNKSRSLSTHSSSGRSARAFAPARNARNSRSPSAHSRKSSRPGSKSRSSSRSYDPYRSSAPKSFFDKLKPQKNWCKFFMQGTCNFTDKTCKFVHPVTCQYWKKGQCKRAANECNGLHGERPVQKARNLHQLVKKQSLEKKHRKTKSPAAKSRSTSRSSQSNGKGKKQKTSPKKAKKKDSGHAKRKSLPR